MRFFHNATGPHFTEPREASHVAHNVTQKYLDTSLCSVGGLRICGYFLKICSIAGGKKRSPMGVVPASQYFCSDLGCLHSGLSSQRESSGLQETATWPL